MDISVDIGTDRRLPLRFVLSCISVRELRLLDSSLDFVQEVFLRIPPHGLRCW